MPNEWRIPTSQRSAESAHSASYEYVIDDSAQPRKTVRFEGIAVHTQCWMSSPRAAIADPCPS